MSVLTLISNLFRLTFGILLLPLRLLGIPMAIIGGMVHFLMRNLLIVLVVIATIFIYRSCTSDNSGGGNGTSQLTPYRAPRQAKNRGNGPVVINPVTRVEDGDSAFATDTYATMSDEERAAYSQVFYDTMNNVKDGETHTWSNYNIGGELRPNDTFTNNVDVRCRHFSEVLKVHEVQQTLTGVACENGDGSWCKLKTNATPGCNLGQPSSSGLIDSIGSSIRNLF